MSRLKEIREKACLSQRELAEKAKVSFVTVARIETGDIVTPHFITIRKLAKALKVKPEDLHFFEDEE